MTTPLHPSPTGWPSTGWPTTSWPTAGPGTTPPDPPARSSPPPFPPNASPQPAPNGGGDRSRAGARWITAMGAFLLLAAATVFVAVRWQQLSDEVKLGILAALTGGFLFAGRRARAALPTTSGVLYHLGAFLVPLNTAAVAIGHDLDWAPFLLLEGATAAGVWFLLDRVERSSTLRWAANAATVVALVGLSATLEHSFGATIPAALLVAGAALAAELTGRRQVALVWALVAGLAPCLALAEATVPLGTDVLDRLGLSGAAPQHLAIVSGFGSAFVIALAARRRRDLVLVVASAVAAGLGVVTGWVGLAPTPTTSVLGAAALFLVVELAVHAVRNDDLWARPARLFAGAVELAAAALTMAVAGLVGDRSLLDLGRVDGRALAAGAFAALAWFVADLRRRQADGTGTGIALLVGAGWWPATIGMTTSILIGVAAGTTSLTPVAVVAVVLAALLVVSGRGGGHVLGAGLAVCAPLAAHAASWPLVLVVGVAGSGVIAAAAVVRARLRAGDDDGLAAWGLAMTAMLPILLARAVIEVAGVDARLALLTVVLSIVGMWVVTAILDLGEIDEDSAHLAMVGRIGQALALVTALRSTPGSIAVAAGVMAALAILDAVRRDDGDPLYGLVVSLPLAVASAALAVDGRIDHAGLALCALAATSVGAEVLAPRRFRPPLATLAVVAALGGLALSAADLASFSTAAILVGAIGLGASAAHEADEGAYFAWTLVTAGIWGHLAGAHVEAIDAYVAPVALALAVIGVRAMRAGAASEGKRTDPSNVSSWIAFGPAIVLLGGAALFDRIDGGSGVHALVAGAVGLVAVIGGGWRRLIAPLFLGTALLVALTVHESLAVTRQVPTWGWLALGGTVLVTVGAVLDRNERSPVESGRRLVDVVHERFD